MKKSIEIKIKMEVSVSWVFRLVLMGLVGSGASRSRIMLERGEKFELRGINLRKADLDYMEYMVKYDS